MDIKTAMLEVLDAPKELRIIITTNYPTFEVVGLGNAYFMIDRGTCDSAPMYDDKGDVITEAESGEVFDYWLVSDSLGQVKKFKTHKELMGFYKCLELGTATDVFVETF